MKLRRVKKLKVRGSGQQKECTRRRALFLFGPVDLPRIRMEQ